MDSKKTTSSHIDDSEHINNYLLRLYVTGASPNSSRAIANIKNICEQYLKNKYTLEIIDVYQQPMHALEEDIVAIPLLIKKFPLPEHRLIGDMSDTKRVLRGLGVILNKE